MKDKEFNEFVILTWNGVEDTKKCVSSIIATVNKPRFIFVDNGSTDNTFHYLESIPKSKIIKVKCGFAQAVNTGLKECVTKYPTVCNNDIVCVGEWHTNLLTGMKACEDVKLLVPTTNNCGESLQWFPTPNCIKPALVKTKEINMVCFMIDREYWLEDAQLDENYVSGVEDIDYCWKINKDGYKVGVCLASFVFHTGSQTNKREFKEDKMKTNLWQGWKKFANKWGVEGALRANDYFQCKDTDELKKVISE